MTRSEKGIEDTKARLEPFAPSLHIRLQPSPSLEQGATPRGPWKRPKEATRSRREQSVKVLLDAGSHVFYVHTDGACATNCPHNEIARMSHAEMQRATSELGLSLRPLPEHRFVGRGVQVARHNRSQCTMRKDVATSVPLKPKLAGSRELLRGQRLLQPDECICVAVQIRTPQVDLVTLQLQRAVRHIPGAAGARCPI